jgi:hypothetical protein
MNEKTWLSIGENCLTQNIINTLKLKSLSTPFSWAISNIDHIIYAMEEKNIFKNKENFYITNDQETKVFYRYSDHTTKKHFAKNSEVLEKMHFPHHNFIEKIEDFKKITTRHQRLYDLSNTDNLIFLYHYRSPDIDEYSHKSLEYVRERLSYFKETFFPNSKIVMFYKLYNETKDVVLINEKDIIEIMILSPENKWQGPGNTFAKKDEDLHKKMIDLAYKTIIKTEKESGKT